MSDSSKTLSSPNIITIRSSYEIRDSQVLFSLITEAIKPQKLKVVYDDTYDGAHLLHIELADLIEKFKSEYGTDSDYADGLTIRLLQKRVLMHFFLQTWKVFKITQWHV